MGVLTRILRPGEARTSLGTLAAPTEELLAILRGGGVTASSGVVVSERTALGYAPVFAALRVLAESVAQLPCLVYRRQGEDRERAREHALYDLLHSQPNLRMSAYEFWEVLVGHVAGWGNGYAEIEWGGDGRIVGLWPLRPDRMTEVRVGDDGRLRYVYEGQHLTWANVLHVRGIGGDGMTGYSVIRMARESIGLGMAAERFGSTIFENGTTPGMLLKHPGVLGDAAYQRLRNAWEERHRGLSNAHRLAILEEGMGVEKIGIPPEDAQFLQTREYQVREVARLFRIPPHMLQDLERATFSNIEHQSIDFVTHTLGPWLKRIEQAAAMQLLSPAERRDYYVEFLAAGLLRGDTSTRYQAYATARQWGWLSANDIRRLENMNGIAGGDEYLTPMNMTALPGEGGETRTALAPASTPEVRQRQREERQARAAGRRRRLSGQYRAVLQDVMQRVINREVNDVRQAARRLLGQRGYEDFDRWLDTFYEEHAQFTERYLRAPFGAYAALTAAELEEEAGTGEELEEEAVAEAVGPYVASRSRIYALRHRSAIRRAALAALEVGEDAGEAVEAELTHLESTAAEDMARDETVRFGNALARALFPLLAVYYLRWVTNGDSCDYCRQLNGKVIHVSGWFAGAGEGLAGAAGVLTPSGNIGHPPLHDGCDCLLVAA